MTDDSLFPESRIFPDVLRRLTSAEQMALRSLLANPTGAKGLPAMNSLAFSRLKEGLFVKLSVKTIPELVLRSVKGAPAGDPRRT